MRVTDQLLLTESSNGAAPKRKERIVAIDALRGLVIVLMALDHSRDFFGDLRIRPEAIESTTVALFFTRWVTHLCAPTFIFLAGVSAWLHGEKLQTRKELSWFLVTRGLWLIFLEFTVVRFGLLFSITLGPWMLIVIAAIGASMILLGLICWLPNRVVLLLGLAVVCGHNLLDGIQAGQLGSAGWIWTLLFRPGYIPAANVAVGYPIVPWFGLMAIGYGISPMLAKPSVDRRKFALGLGLALVAGFLLLRSFDFYGDPQKWNWQPATAAAELTSVDMKATESIDFTRTMFSFLATSKYPPSLLFAMMTIGPTLLILALFDWLGKTNPAVRFFKVFGSVPLFFYVLHFYLLHLGAWGLYWVYKGVLISPMHIDAVPEVPPEYGFNHPGWLWQVYVGWLIVVAILFPLCFWFREMKRNGKSKAWSYL